LISEFFSFFLEKHAEIAQLTLQHAIISATAVGLATVIGIPLGILLVRARKTAALVIALANIIQTIPSLALLGMLMVLPYIGGIGERPAITALFLYSLLAIIRNTHVGISQVNPVLIEVGKGMGMTSWQLLTLVELPQALPFIMAGIRIATVICIGTATIASAIGAGGLGQYIFRGIYRNHSVMVLWGAIPAATLALLADWGLGKIETALKK